MTNYGKVGLVVPIHLKGNRDNECYRLAIRYYCSLGILVHICGSEGELSKSFASEFLSDNVKYFEVPQPSVCYSSAGDDVLREKFNNSLKTLPRDLDWHILVGANDIGYGVIEKLGMLDPNHILMTGVGMDNDLYLLDEDRAWNAHKVVLTYKTKFDLLAGINCFSRKMMEACDYRPYQMRGCETGAELFTKSLKGRVIGLEGKVIMFKGKGDLNTLEKILKVHKTVKITQREIEWLRGFVD